MARRRYAFEEDRITPFHKEGRGTGRGGNYKPWLTVQDVPSPGSPFVLVEPDLALGHLGGEFDGSARASVP
ncbi:MAG: hypothetical protein ACLGJC_24050 [Alphaproteobacteria bacterium]